VIIWLQYLKDYYPDYHHITISLNRINTLLVNKDVSLSFTAIINYKDLVQDQPVLAKLPLPNSQFIIPNLNITIIKVDLIINKLASHKLLAPFICSTLINKAARKDRIFAIAFPTLYLTRLADFNTSKLQKVDLNNYA
jgi:hypothetical protein